MKDLITLEQIHFELGLAITAARQNEELRKEVEHWKGKYMELLDDSIKTSERTSANMLLLALGKHFA